jgi:mannose-6-phosphate isomerase-like protein (cupin superfamily)
MTCVVDMADPARGEDGNAFQGFRHGAGVSFIVVQEGTATFTAGDEIIEARGGQVVVVMPAGVAHKFVNTGARRLS